MGMTLEQKISYLKDKHYNAVEDIVDAMLAGYEGVQDERQDNLTKWLESQWKCDFCGKKIGFGEPEPTTGKYYCDECYIEKFGERNG